MKRYVLALGVYACAQHEQPTPFVRLEAPTATATTMATSPPPDPAASVDPPTVVKLPDKAEPRDVPVTSDAKDSLDGSDIERTVNEHRVSLRRHCWEADSGLVAASVKVHVIVAPDGSVKSGRGSGTDPALVRCIEDSITRWKFPSARSPTEFEIPFRFVP